jgi:preprotein translocase subunit YajC
MHKWILGTVLSLSLFSTQLLLAQEEELPAGRDSGMWQTFIMIAIAMVFFYFILWRPEQKRRKALEEQRQTLKKGDKVTAMGIVGVVSKVQEETIILSMYDGSKIEVVKGAITDFTPGKETETVEKNK